MHSSLRSVLLVLLAVPACSSTTSSTTGVPPVTELVVDPTRFLGDVACLDAPGAMRLYVATLTDVSSNIGLDAAPPRMPSSAPTPCGVAVHFQRIVQGQRYVADVQAYDRTDLIPLSCWQDPGASRGPRATCAGSPVMVDAVTGRYVAPRWTTSCGRTDGEARAASASRDGGASDAVAPTPPTAPSVPPTRICQTDGGQRPGGPVCAQYLTSVTLGGCAPLREVATGASTTTIGVSLSAALGGAGCATSAGTIESFTVQLEGQPSTLRHAACGSAAEFDGLVGGVSYRFDVSATIAGTSTELTTTCYRTAVRGVSLAAACDPFPVLHGG